MERLTLGEKNWLCEQPMERLTLGEKNWLREQPMERLTFDEKNWLCESTREGTQTLRLGSERTSSRWIQGVDEKS